MFLEPESWFLIAFSKKSNYYSLKKMVSFRTGAVNMQGKPGASPSAR